MEQAALCEDSIVYRTPGQELIDAVGLHDWSLGLTVYDATLAALREAEDDSIILPQIQTESSDDVVLALQSLEAAVRSHGNSFLLNNPDNCPFGFCRNNSLIGCHPSSRPLRLRSLLECDARCAVTHQAAPHRRVALQLHHLPPHPADPSRL
eukprot:3941784-Rhodomonas_salina.2